MQTTSTTLGQRETSAKAPTDKYLAFPAACNSCFQLEVVLSHNMATYVSKPTALKSHAPLPVVALFLGNASVYVQIIARLEATAQRSGRPHDACLHIISFGQLIGHPKYVPMFSVLEIGLAS